MRMKFVILLVSAVISGIQAQTIDTYQPVAQNILKEALGSNYSYEMLNELATKVGHRLAGSPGAEKAVRWSKQQMEKLGFDRVWSEPVMVPHWVRGSVEQATLIRENGKRESLKITALGGTIGTPRAGIIAEVVEVKSFEELRMLGSKAHGKIIFFNRPMDRTLFNTFPAYGGAVDQRSAGAIEAARAGGVAALVRSMTTTIDDVPHTGAMGYVDSLKKVAGIAVSTRDAEKLSIILASGERVKVQINLSAHTLPEVESANVIGELRGTEKPEEVIVIGGHLDSWDVGQGAHDDGAGCVQSIEALRILKKLGLKPKRTIRAVMFMNEENGLRGGTAYAAKERPGERQIVAIESDMGGFSPQGFGVSDSAAFEKISQWAPLFKLFDAGKIQRGGGGSDISPLGAKGVVLMSMIVDVQRYFDYHHSANDVIGNVNERELALGSSAIALMAYLMAQEGL
ncbi:MAG: M20/M25/M40 family metallo-hydrolase [bacterium]